MLELAAIVLTVTAVLAWFNERYVHLPATIGVMVIALFLSLVIQGLASVGINAPAALTRGWVEALDFDSLLMNGMLSFLLFAGALHVDIKKLRDYWASIGVLAILGTIVSTILIGFASHWLLGILGVPVALPWCLVFGALISPTDPVAVLGIMRGAGAPDDMEVRIVGESLFNDGVAVVLFTLLLSAAQSGESLAGGHALMLFVEEAGGGVLFGLLLGYGVHALMKRVDQYQVEVLLSLAMVLGGYTLATHLHVSGPIAMVVAGLVVGNHAWAHAMSTQTRQHLNDFWELIDEILNALLFVIIGLELLALPFHWNYLLVAVPLIALLIAVRFIVVAVPVSLAHRHFRRGSIAVLTWGGLRGGISVALALSLPPGDSRDILLNVTYLIVLFSIVSQGLTIGTLVRRVLKPTA
ncbi:cation:proton antiporter [Salinicola rhizosphaerae]|uniref:Sodium:proton antiporter n=1 Tax=Salinicola rhizosphaerae TaxID=1443141 RepID=A0ABQ3EC52_9GAMM|nr:sodium:proton antiporter [Salinicola rhizosphaerae]GHB31727.1 sodium:proton antiporter [Salinicola rhizosphaerae]